MMESLVIKSEALFKCHNPLEDYSCTQCNYTTHMFQRLKQHLKQHYSVIIKEKEFSLYKCKTCFFQTLSSLFMLIHKYKKCMKPSKPKPQFSCNQCQFTTKSSYNLKQHDLLKHMPHHLIKWFSCDLCDYKGKTSQLLKKHLNITHSEDRNFQCQHCGYSAKRKAQLKSHILLLHTSEDVIKWFPCEHCPYKAKSNSRLRSHYRVRHDECPKWFACDQCEFKTKLKTNLNKHNLRRHPSENFIKWFLCEQCAYKCVTQNSLMKHMRGKHGFSRSFYCAHCDYSCMNKSDLRIHINVKHAAGDRIKWFQCSLCKYKGKAKRYLRRHYINHHWAKVYDEDTNESTGILENLRKST